MPRIEDLPMPAQAQIAAQRSAEAPQGGADKKRMTLLQRLAAVGLGRPDADEPAPAPAPAPVQPNRLADPRMAPPRPPEAQRRPQAPRQAPPQGHHPEVQPRQAPQVRSIEDEQLEIPAFLRRHTS
jgi:cell division protein FtsZ